MQYLAREGRRALEVGRPGQRAGELGAEPRQAMVALELQQIVYLALRGRGEQAAGDL